MLTANKAGTVYLKIHIPGMCKRIYTYVTSVYVFITDAYCYISPFIILSDRLYKNKLSVFLVFSYIQKFTEMPRMLYVSM